MSRSNIVELLLLLAIPAGCAVAGHLIGRAIRGCSSNVEGGRPDATQHADHRGAPAVDDDDRTEK